MWKALLTHFALVQAFKWSCHLFLFFSLPSLKVVLSHVPMQILSPLIAPLALSAAELDYIAASLLLNRVSYSLLFFWLPSLEALAGQTCPRRTRGTSGQTCPRRRHATRGSPSIDCVIFVLAREGQGKLERRSSWRIRTADPGEVVKGKVVQEPLLSTFLLLRASETRKKLIKLHF